MVKYKCQMCGEIAEEKEILTEEKSTRIKVELNNIMLMHLPPNATIKTADKIACDTWGKIVDLWGGIGGSGEGVKESE